MKITRAPKKNQHWLRDSPYWILYEGSLFEFTQYLSIAGIPWWLRGEQMPSWDGQVVIWERGTDRLWIQHKAEYLAKEFNSLGEEIETSKKDK